MMRLFLQSLSALVLSFAVVGCVSPVKVDDSGAVKPGTNKSGVFFKTANADVTGSVKALKNQKTVFIPLYEVMYVKKSRSVESASPVLGSAKEGVKVRADVELLGVNDSTFQQITNEAYADFRQKLQAAGYTIIDDQKVQSHPKYADMKQRFPDTGSKKSTFAAPGQTKPSLLATGLVYGKLCTDLNAVLLSPEMAVDHTAYAGKSKWLFNSGSAKINLGQCAHAGGRLSVVTTKGGGYLQLGQPTYSEKTFGTYEEDTSAVIVATETAVKALSVLAGGTTSTTKQYKLHADQAKYKAAALDALKEANTRFVNAMVEQSK